MIAMPIYRYLRIILTLLVFSCTVHAQEARMEISPGEVQIGQHSRLSVELEAPSGYIVLFPAALDTLSRDIEVVRWGVPDTISISNGDMLLRQVHTITAWEEGYYPVPPQNYKFVSGSDTLHAQTRPALLQVSGVEVDMESQYRDIHPIWRIPVSALEILGWVVPIVLLMLLALYLVKRFYSKESAERKPSIWENPDVPAHIAAISSIETLRRKELWQSGRVKQYYSELSIILRKYISRRYNINAIEMTTAEIMNKLTPELEKENLARTAREIFETADLVKFAKHDPLPEVNNRVLEMALEFVRGTIPQTNEE